MPLLNVQFILEFGINQDAGKVEEPMLANFTFYLILYITDRLIKLLIQSLHLRCNYSAP